MRDGEEWREERRGVVISNQQLPPRVNLYVEASDDMSAGEILAKIKIIYCQFGRGKNRGSLLIRPRGEGTFPGDVRGASVPWAAAYAS